MTNQKKEITAILRELNTAVTNAFTDAIIKINSIDDAADEAPATDATRPAREGGRARTRNIYLVTADEDDDEDYYDEEGEDYFDEDEYEAPLVPSVTFSTDDNGDVVETLENAPTRYDEETDAPVEVTIEDLFAETAELVAERRDREANAFGVDEDYEAEAEADHLEVAYSLVDRDDVPLVDTVLTEAQVRQVLSDPRSIKSLSKFGNLQLVRVKEGNTQNEKVAVFSIIREGVAPLGGLSYGLMGYRGSLPFPGIGIVHAQGRATQGN